MKSITMTMRDERGTATITENFDDDANWPAIAYTFKKFLSSMGYLPAEGAVGECVESYLAHDANQGELW